MGLLRAIGNTIRTTGALGADVATGGACSGSTASLSPNDPLSGSDKKNAKPVTAPTSSCCFALCATFK